MYRRGKALSTLDLPPANEYSDCVLFSLVALPYVLLFHVGTHKLHSRHRCVQYLSLCDPPKDPYNAAGHRDL